MRRLLLVFAMLFGLLLTTAPLAAAQNDDVDVAEVGEAVLDADPETIVEGLENPPDDDQLPEGFINPPDGTPENEELGAAFELPVSDLEGSIASVNFAFDTDPDVIEGLISAGYLNYVVLEDEVTDDMLEEFKSGAEEGMENNTDESIEFAIEDIEVGGADAVLITVTTTDEGASAVVQMVAVPVGNAFVIGTALVADQEEVDAAAVQTHAEDLTLAGVEYLGTLAEAE
jgi:hypothetical protein